MSVRIGVVSDSHGNQEYLAKAAEELVGLGAETLLHLGDDETDAQSGMPLPVYSVPGKYEPAYEDEARRTRVLEFEGWRVAMAHIEADLPDGDICVYGHTHVPLAETRGAMLRLCPGHLKSEVDKGEGPSFALLLLDKPRILATIFRLGEEEPFVTLSLTREQTC